MDTNFLLYCYRQNSESMNYLYEKNILVIEVGSVITISFAGISFFLADHPSASMPALLMAGAGLITAFSGLATAIGGQIIPVIGHWFDARREARLAMEARSSVFATLKSAIDRVTELEGIVRDNEKMIVKNSKLMQEIAARNSSTDWSKDISLGISDALSKLDNLKASVCTKEECTARNEKVLQMISELDAIVRKNDEKVIVNSGIIQKLIDKVEYPKES